MTELFKQGVAGFVKVVQLIDDIRAGLETRTARRFNPEPGAIVDLFVQSEQLLD